MLQHTTEGALGREIAISLIYNDNTIKETKHLYDSLAIDVIARRVVRAAEPYHLGILIADINDLLGRNLIVLIEQHRAILHVVHIGTHLIHSVGRRNRYHIVLARTTEHTVNQVDGLIRAIAQENLVFSYPLDLTHLLFQFHLQWVRVSVIRVIIGILVGIEEDAGISASEFRASATVRCQVPDVFSAQVF